MKISSFNARTHADLLDGVLGLTQAATAGIKGYIIDLRNNPGGLLDEAIAVADDFLDSGVIVVSKAGKPPTSNSPMRTRATKSPMKSRSSS